MWTTLECCTFRETGLAATDGTACTKSRVISLLPRVIYNTISPFQLGNAVESATDVAKTTPGLQQEQKESQTNPACPPKIPEI